MTTITIAWSNALAAFGAVTAALITVSAGCGVLLVGWALRRAVRELRRAIRYRRVARELERTHQAAYRERFGARGRLA
jgi:hypothetical protein